MWSYSITSLICTFAWWFLIFEYNLRMLTSWDVCLFEYSSLCITAFSQEYIRANSSLKSHADAEARLIRQKIDCIQKTDRSSFTKLCNVTFWLRPSAQLSFLDQCVPPIAALTAWWKSVHYPMKSAKDIHQRWVNMGWKVACCRTKNTASTRLKNPVNQGSLTKMHRVHFVLNCRCTRAHLLWLAEALTETNLEKQLMDRSSGKSIRESNSFKKDRIVISSILISRMAAAQSGWINDPVPLASTPLKCQDNLCTPHDWKLNSQRRPSTWVGVGNGVPGATVAEIPGKGGFVIAMIPIECTTVCRKLRWSYVLCGSGEMGWRLIAKWRFLEKSAYWNDNRPDEVCILIVSKKCWSESAWKIEYWHAGYCTRDQSPYYPILMAQSGDSRTRALPFDWFGKMNRQLAKTAPKSSNRWGGLIGIEMAEMWLPKEWR